MPSANTDLGITLGARVDTSQAQKDIDAFTRNDSGNKSRKIVLNADIDLKNISDKLSHAIEKGYTSKINESFQKISTNITKNLSGVINGKEFNDLTKVVERFKSDLGEIQERVTVFREGAVKPVAHSLQTIKEGVKDVSSTTNTVIKDIDGVTTKVTTLEKTIKDTDNQKHKIITTTKEWIDGQNKLHQEIQTTDENGKALSTTINNITDDTRKATKLMNEFANATKKVAQSSDGVDRTETKTWIDKNGVKTVEQYKNGILQLTTITREYVNDNKELVVEVQKLEGEERKLVSVNTQKKRDLQEENRLLNENIDATFKARQEKEKLAEAERKAQEQIERGLVSTTSTSFKTTTTQFGDTSGQQYEALAKQIIKVDEAGKKTITTIYEFENAQKQLVRQTRITDENNKKLAQDTIQVSDAEKKVSDSARKATTETNKYGESAKRAAVETKTFGQQLSDAIVRLARYYIASMPIQMVRKGITEAIQTVKEFDNALIEFRKVSDLAGESLTRYVAKLAEMGEVTGSTMQAMVEASTEFRKSGFSDEDSAKLASIAEKYRNIADEEISAGESASFIIAQMKAFNIEADQAEHIIDSVNEVANNFSVSSADLATNLGNMSAIMAINNVSMEEQIGMLTGVTEITRNASSASRGLVMVSSRLTQVLDDTSSTGKKLTKIYNDLGIELKDENGQLRSHYDILGDLAKQWNNLSENQQKYIALTSAGARQQQNFVALMSNWNQVASATSTAYKSIGSAQKENEKVMESITKKVEILKSQFQQLVIGKGGLQEFAKNILDVGIALLKFANSDVGKVIIKTTALMASIGLLVKGFNSLISYIPTLAKSLSATALSLNKLAGAMSTNVVSTNSYAASLMGLTSGEVVATSATKSLTVAVKEFTAALMSNPFTLILGLVAAVAASMYALKQAYEETVETINESREKISELKSEINELRATTQKEAVVSQAEKDKLKYLEKRLELTKELLDKNERMLKAAQSAGKSPNTVGQGTDFQKYQKTKVGEYYKSDPRAAQMLANGNREEILKRADIIKQQTGIDVAREAQYQKETKALELNKKGLDEETLARLNLIDVEKSELASYINLNTEIANWNDSSKKGLELLDEKYNESQNHLNALIAERDRLGELRDAYTKNQEEYNKLSNKQSLGIKLTKEEQEELDKLKNTKRALSYVDAERLDVLEKNIGVYEKSANAFSTYQGIIDEFGEESEEADNIITEFAKDLGISEEALIANANAMGLSIDSYYQFAMAIKESNAEIDNFQSSIDTLASAVDEYNESQYLSIDTVQALLSLQPEYLAMLSEENGQLVLNEQAIIDKCNALIEERKQTALQMAYERLSAIERGENQAATESQSGAIASNASELDNESNALSRNTIEQYANRIARNDKSKGTAASEVVRELAQELSMLDKIGDSYSKITSGSKKAGKAGAGGAKQATDAQKELNKELEETKSKYDKVISFITGRIDKQTKAVQKQKDAEVDAIEKIIKAREKQKDKELDAIEEQINALEKEKDAREKYWDDQIDALKKANDERKDALELQEKLDALEKAKNTKVKIYKEGQGFVYDVDQTAVAEAQQALDEYLSEKAYEDELERLEALKDAEVNNYDQRLDALNQYKDNVQKSYEDQIAALEAQREALEEQYDAQIEYYNNFKEQFEDMVKAYEDKQTELLASQLTGINFENNNWMTRLDNLAKFVSEYNKLQEQLNTGNTNVKNTATMSSGGGLPSGGKGTTKSANIGGSSSTGGKNQGGAGSQSGSAGLQLSALSANRKRVLGYASGTPSVKDNEIAIVGENPNQEIVIGSKINNGELMSLEKGAGVVNADSSKTIAGLLNQVGQFGASGFGSGNGTLSNINNDSLTINGVTIQGANINDPQTFVNGLLNLKAEALQRAYRHR